MEFTTSLHWHGALAQASLGRFSSSIASHTHYDLDIKSGEEEEMQAVPGAKKESTYPVKT